MRWSGTCPHRRSRRFVSATGSTVFGALSATRRQKSSRRRHGRAIVAGRALASASRPEPGDSLARRKGSHPAGHDATSESGGWHQASAISSNGPADLQDQAIAAWDSLRPDADSSARHGEASDEMLTQLLTHVIWPTILSFVGGALVYAPVCEVLQNLLDIGNTGSGPVLSLLGMDQSQFMQNFLTVNGLLFTILCGDTYTSLYRQQEMLYHALFREVSEAKSLLEQACLVCQGRPFYPEILESIGDYITKDLRQLDAEPADLLAKWPMEDPLEYILYATSVGVPSVIYDTIRDLRQARSARLGAMQRKLPGIHFVLLYVLGVLELLAFPLLGAGTASMFRERNVLVIQAIFFGAMCGAIVMTLQVIYELWNPFGGAYTVDVVLAKMVRGLEEELRARREL